VQALVALVLLAAVAGGGYLLWSKLQSAAVVQPRTPPAEETVQKAPGEAVPVPAPPPAKAETDLLVALEDGLVLEGAQRPIAPLSSGQPMFRKEAGSDRIKVALRTPEGIVEGWVPKDKVREAPEYDPADALGCDNSSRAGHQNAVSRFCFEPGGKHVASLATGDRAVNVWDSTDGRLVRSYHGHGASPVGVGFLDGKVASVCPKDGMRIWSPETTATLRKHAQALGDFVFLPGGAQRLEVRGAIARVFDLAGSSPVACSSETTLLQEFRVASAHPLLVALTSKQNIESYWCPELQPSDAFPVAKGTGLLDLSPNAERVAIHTAPEIKPDGPTEYVPDFKTGFVKEVTKKSENKLAGKHLVQVVARKTGKLERQIVLGHVPAAGCFCGNDKLVLVKDTKDSADVLLLTETRPKRLATVNTPAGAQITAIAGNEAGDTLAVGYSTGSVELYRVTPTGLRPAAPETAKTGPAPALSDAEKKAKRYYDFMRQFLANQKPDDARTYYRKLVEECPDSPFRAKAEKDLEAAGVSIE
jgi:hypothetical protein